ncbi:JAB domain-containing protein [Sphingomonas sp. JC676]|nr:JAB domain-containing protein [Sphingomonas sp. JC676]
MLPKPAAPPRRIADPDAAGALFADLAREAAEVAAFAYLAGDQRLLGLRRAGRGAIDRIELPIRAIVADVLALDAFAVVMAHNHPSGDPTPSAADREVTHLLARALDPLGVRLIDHLVIAAGGITSFRLLGLL